MKISSMGWLVVVDCADTACCGNTSAGTCVDPPAASQGELDKQLLGNNCSVVPTLAARSKIGGDGIASASGEPEATLVCTVLGAVNELAPETLAMVIVALLRVGLIKHALDGNISFTMVLS